MRVFSIFIGLTLNALLGALSFLVPKKKGTILLGGGLGKGFSGNPKYLFLHLHGRGPNAESREFKSTWITRSDAVLTRLRRDELPVVDARTMSGFWQILRSEYLVLESGTAIGSGAHDIAYERLLIGRFNIVQTWHGCPMKRIALDALRDREHQTLLARMYFYVCRFEHSTYRAILALSDTDAKVFQGAFNNGNVFTLGYPRNDPLANCSGKAIRVGRYEKFDKVIVYAPTFRDTSDAKSLLSLKFLDELNGKLADRNWYLAVKKHQYDRMLEIPDRLSHIRDVTAKEADIQKLLLLSDLLVTDFSSLFVDYLLLSRPIISYFADLEDYLKKSRGMYYDIRELMPGPLVNSEEHLGEAIFTVDEWWNSHEFQERHERALSRHHKFVDNKSCQRLESALQKGFQL